MGTALAFTGLALLRILLPVALLFMLGSSLERKGTLDSS
jgi:hypothetical protein